MKVQVEETSPIERKLSIEVEPGTVSQELNRAYAALSRQVKVAGFRPGKVPRRILEQRFKQEVESDVIRRVMERAYSEAIREHKVEVVSAPRVTNEALRPDAPFRFQARVDVKPKIEPKDYLELPLKKVEHKVDDASGRATREDEADDESPRTSAESGDCRTRRLRACRLRRYFRRPRVSREPGGEPHGGGRSWRVDSVQNCGARKHQGARLRLSPRLSGRGGPRQDRPLPDSTQRPEDPNRPGA